MAIISGTTRQQKLYRHLGFVPFGPLVGKGEAMFQPMYLTLEGFEKKAEEFFTMPVNLPGPASFFPGRSASTGRCARPLGRRRNRTGRIVLWRNFSASASGCAS